MKICTVRSWKSINSNRCPTQMILRCPLLEIPFNIFHTRHGITYVQLLKRNSLLIDLDINQTIVSVWSSKINSWKSRISFRLRVTSLARCNYPNLTSCICKLEHDKMYLTEGRFFCYLTFIELTSCLFYCVTCSYEQFIAAVSWCVWVNPLKCEHCSTWHTPNFIS